MTIYKKDQGRPSSAASCQGLDTGDIVVTAGVQALHADQKVRLLPQTS